MNYIPIVDVGVGTNMLAGTNTALIKGIEMNVFCYSPTSGQRFKGKVWPGTSYFPDFFHPNASEYWGTMMYDLYKKVNFTGMWLDMNEPSNFCHGECEWTDTLVPSKIAIIVWKRKLHVFNNLYLLLTYGLFAALDESKPEYIRKEFNLPFVPGHDIETNTLRNTNRFF